MTIDTEYTTGGGGGGENGGREAGQVGAGWKLVNHEAGCPRPIRCTRPGTEAHAAQHLCTQKTI